MTEQRQFDLAYTGCAAAEYALRRVIHVADARSSRWLHVQSEREAEAVAGRYRAAGFDAQIGGAA
jgi:hypothetical protein